MIIKLKGANFSTNNINALLNSYFVSITGGSCVTASNNIKSVSKDSATYSNTFTVKAGYTVSNVEVWMSGSLVPGVVNETTSEAGTVFTISLPTVTGNVSIKFTYTYKGAEEPENPGSGEVVDPETPTGPVWYITSLDDVAASGKDITGGTVFTGSSIAPVAFDNTFNAKLVGKTIDMVEFVPEKVGEISFGVYDTNTYVYTKKASITIAEADLETRKTYTFTPFTVSSGELFTFYESGNNGCMSYYLSKDAPGVDYCKGLQTKCDGAAPTAFNYDLVTLINVGNSSGGSSNVTPESPSEGTTWYINSLQQLQDSGNDIATNRVELAPSSGYHWAFNQFNPKLTGKTINTIELMPCKSGTFTIGIFDTSANTVTDTRSFTIDAADINTVKTYTFEDLTIPSDKYFVWNCSGKSSNGGEASGYYVLKDKLDPLAVETSQWYQAKSTGLAAFSTYWLAFVANIGYTAK